RSVARRDAAIVPRPAPVDSGRPRLGVCQRGNAMAASAGGASELNWSGAGSDRLARQSTSSQSSPTWAWPGASMSRVRGRCWRRPASENKQYSYATHLADTPAEPADQDDRSKQQRDGHGGRSGRVANSMSADKRRQRTIAWVVVYSGPRKLDS